MTRTVHDAGGVHVELADGALTGLRYREGLAAGPGAVETIRTVVNEAWRRHRRERAAAADGDVAHDGADHAFVASFVAAQLDRAKEIRPTSEPAWGFPRRADARAAADRVHVSVDDDGLVLLEVTEDLLAEPREACHAIQAAFALARRRLDDDTRDYLARHQGLGDDDLDAVSWSDLAASVDALGRAW